MEAACSRCGVAAPTTGGCSDCAERYCSAHCHRFAHRPALGNALLLGAPVAGAPEPLAESATAEEVAQYRETYSNFLCEQDRRQAREVGGKSRPTNPMDRATYRYTPKELAALPKSYSTYDTKTLANVTSGARKSIIDYMENTFTNSRHDLALNVIDYICNLVQVYPVTDPNNPARGGYGGFARRDLPAYKVLGLYGGEVWSSADVQTLHQGNCLNRTAADEERVCQNYVWAVSTKDRSPEDLSILGLHGGNLLRYVNSGQDSFFDSARKNRPANAKAFSFWYEGAPRVLYFTTRPIAKGEELLVDYFTKLSAKAASVSSESSSDESSSSGSTAVYLPPDAVTRGQIKEGKNIPELRSIETFYSNELRGGQYAGMRFFRFKVVYPNMTTAVLEESQLIQGKGLYHPLLATYIGKRKRLRDALPFVSELRGDYEPIRPTNTSEEQSLSEEVASLSVDDEKPVGSIRAVLRHHFIPYATPATKYRYVFDVQWDDDDQVVTTTLEELTDFDDDQGQVLDEPVYHTALLSYLRTTMHLGPGYERRIFGENPFVIELLGHEASPPLAQGGTVLLFDLLMSDGRELRKQRVPSVELFHYVVNPAMFTLRGVVPNALFDDYIRRVDTYGTPVQRRLLDDYIVERTSTYKRAFPRVNVARPSS